MARFLLLFSLLVHSIYGLSIVSLGPAVTNQLLLLGVGDSIIGKTDYCPKNAGISEKVISVGTVLNQNIEAIVALQPDIIFTSGLTSEKSIKSLQKMGITTIPIDDPASFEMLCSNFSTIAKAVGKSKIGDSIVTLSKERLATIHQERKSAKRVFFALGTKPLFSVTANTLGDELITLAGGKNIFQLIGSGVVNREAVFAKDPEVIFISEMGEMSRVEQQRWLAFKSLSATRNSAIHLVDAYAIGSPTPLSFVETVKKLQKLIQQ